MPRHAGKNSCLFSKLVYYRTATSHDVADFYLYRQINTPKIIGLYEKFIYHAERQEGGSVSQNIDTVELRLFFENVGWPGIVSMIDYLTSPEGRGCMKIGSGTIDLFTVPGEDPGKRLLEYRHLYIGIPGRETPLEGLVRIMKSYGSLPPESVFAFNLICTGIVRSVRAHHATDAPRDDGVSILF